MMYHVPDPIGGELVAFTVTVSFEPVVYGPRCGGCGAALDADALSCAVCGTVRRAP
jgi:hypothetical protein